MTNHPGRHKREGWALEPITPAVLRTMIELAAITQSEAAQRCYAGDRTMRDWLAGTARMPLSASECLALSLMWPGEARLVQPTLALVERWLRPQFSGLVLCWRS